MTQQSLQQRNEILQKVVDRTGRSLKAQNQIVEGLVEDLETALHSDVESSEHQPLQVRSLVQENGKSRWDGLLD